jgi:hypothetical protein
MPFASRVMREASSDAISLPVLCELVWVWQRAVCLAMAVWLARPAVEAGLAPQEAGGGLVDGVIALEGQWLGGYTSISLNLRSVAPLR